MHQVKSLIKASLSAGTRKAYNKAWNRFGVFLSTIRHKQRKLPVSHTDILLYIAHLHQQKMAPSSISCQLSAISHFHKMKGLGDPCKHFLVIKAVTGTRNLTRSIDVRLPITRPMLRSLIDALPSNTKDGYERKLLTAMFTMAFHGFLRIGEMIPRSRKLASQALSIKDIELADSMVITLHQFKHSSKQGAQTIRIQKDHSFGRRYCPVNAMRKYLAIRGHKTGPLFLLHDGNPYIRSRFDQRLRSCLISCNFSTISYKGHSFRIGAATDAAERGCSDAQIRNLGRWASDAYRKYIRISPRNTRLNKAGDSG